MFQTISDLSTITGGQAAALPAPRDDFGREQSPVGSLAGSVAGGGKLPRPTTREIYPPIYQLPGFGSSPGR